MEWAGNKPLWFDSCDLTTVEGRRKLKGIYENLNASYVEPMIYAEGRFLPTEIKFDDNVAKIYGLYVEDQ